MCGCYFNNLCFYQGKKRRNKKKRESQLVFVGYWLGCEVFLRTRRVCWLPTLIQTCAFRGSCPREGVQWVCWLIWGWHGINGHLTTTLTGCRLSRDWISSSYVIQIGKVLLEGKREEKIWNNYVDFDYNLTECSLTSVSNVTLEFWDQYFVSNICVTRPTSLQIHAKLMDY